MDQPTHDRNKAIAASLKQKRRNEEIFGIKVFLREIAKKLDANNDGFTEPQSWETLFDTLVKNAGAR